MLEAPLDLPLVDGVADAEATSLSYGQQRGVELARARHWESVDYSQSFGRGMDREMVGRYVNA